MLAQSVTPGAVDHPALDGSLRGLLDFGLCEEDIGGLDGIFGVRRLGMYEGRWSGGIDV